MKTASKIVIEQKQKCAAKFQATSPVKPGSREVIISVTWLSFFAQA